jgi:hypothetical protein
MDWRPCLAMLLLLLFPSPAQADARAEAQALMESGNRAAAREDWPRALQSYEDAYRVFASDKILLNQGTALRALGRYADAANAYQAYLDGDAVDPRKKAEVEGLLEEMDLRVARLRIELSVPASVRVDGRSVKKGDVVTLRVEPGEHTLVAQPERGRLVERRIVARAGEGSTIELGSQAFTPPPPAGPAAPRPDVSADAKADGTTQRTLGVIALGAGGAGLVGGVILGVLAADRNSEAERYCLQKGGSCTTEGVELGDDATGLATGSTIAFLAGAGFAVGGLALIFTAPSGKTAKVTQLTVRQGRISLSSRF